MRQVAGMRTTTPACSSAATSLRNCSACCASSAADGNLAGVHHALEPGAVRGGALHRHQQREQALAVAGARVFLQRLAGGRCCALACADSRVVYVARNMNSASSSRRFSARLKCTRPDQVPGEGGGA